MEGITPDEVRQMDIINLEERVRKLEQTNNNVNCSLRDEELESRNGTTSIKDQMFNQRVIDLEYSLVRKG